MFTGTGNEELAVRALKRGFDDYVVKGATQLRRLAMAVRSAYDRRRQLLELGESRDLVLKELYHRLHNNLQIVISLLRMTEKATTNGTDREQLADLGRRIQALSALQEETMELPVDLAVPFGLIANEILTIALKHAFPDGRTGHLSVALERAADRAVLTIADDGAGYPGDLDLSAAASSLGMRVIRRLADQVEGEVSFERGEAGAICRISVPV
jgi:two-component sensor histidine kinase